MKEVPKHIVEKLESYYKHSQKAEELRIKIEQWFVTQGMTMNDDKVDYPITDILIDTSLEDIEGAVILLNEVLNELE